MRHRAQSVPGAPQASTAIGVAARALPEVMRTLGHGSPSELEGAWHRHGELGRRHRRQRPPSSARPDGTAEGAEAVVVLVLVGHGTGRLHCSRCPRHRIHLLGRRRSACRCASSGQHPKPRPEDRRCEEVLALTADTGWRRPVPGTTGGPGPNLRLAVPGHGRWPRCGGATPERVGNRDSGDVVRSASCPGPRGPPLRSESAPRRPRSPVLWTITPSSSSRQGLRGSSRLNAAAGPAPIGAGELLDAEDRIGDHDAGVSGIVLPPRSPPEG
jgi:hypothetical protein